MKDEVAVAVVVLQILPEMETVGKTMAAWKEVGEWGEEVLQEVQGAEERHKACSDLPERASFKKRREGMSRLASYSIVTYLLFNQEFRIVKL